MRTPRYPFVCLAAFRLWLGLAAILFLSSVFAAAADTPLPAGRLIGTFDGIEVEYSPGQEELARLLGERFAVRNRAAQTNVPDPGLADASVPLSPADLRANRTSYLAAIAAQLALKSATPWQEECYDAFLDNYEQSMHLTTMLWQGLAQSLNGWKRVTLWDRNELVRRQEGGETIIGFSWDPVTKKGSANFSLPAINYQDDRLKEIVARREKLKHDYQFRMNPTEGGGTTYHASVGPGKKPAAAKPEAETPPVAAKPELKSFLVIIRSDLAGLPTAELADKLWDREVKGILDSVANPRNRPKIDLNIAFLVLHETTEVGIVDRYYRGNDRRWFCDGVANYVPWRVVRDLHGPELANRAYDIQALLEKYADLAQQVDLRKWPAAEHQKEGAQDTRLSFARYTFAAQTVFLMNERAGEDVLPRLFTEIGKTKANKVSMTTVEKAWKKVAGTKLDAILAEAVQAAATPVAAGTAATTSGTASAPQGAAERPDNTRR